MARGLVSFGRLPEDGTPTPKYAAVDTHHESYFMFCILLSASVGCYSEYKKMHGMSNIKFSGNYLTMKP